MDAQTLAWIVAVATLALVGALAWDRKREKE